MSWTTPQRQFSAGRYVIVDELMAEVRSVVAQFNGGIDRENIDESSLDPTHLALGASSKLLGIDRVTADDYTQASLNLNAEIKPLESGGDPWVLEFDSADEQIEALFCGSLGAVSVYLILDGVVIASTENHYGATTIYTLCASVPVGAGTHRLEVWMYGGKVRDRTMSVRGVRR